MEGAAGWDVHQSPMGGSDGMRRFFFLQFRAVQARYSYLPSPLSDHSGILDRAGAGEYSEHFGAARCALAAFAKLTPQLSAQFGRRIDVTEYPTWQVLQTQHMEAFNNRVVENANHLMQQRKPT